MLAALLLMAPPGTHAQDASVGQPSVQRETQQSTLQTAVSTNKSSGPYSDRLMSLFNNTNSFRSLPSEEAFNLLTSIAMHDIDKMTPSQKRGLALLFSTARRRGAALDVSVEKPLEGLVSTNYGEGGGAAVVLDRQRAELVNRLLAICNSTNSVRVKGLAIIVLGQYRASEAVPFLVQHLEWDNSIDMMLNGGWPRNSVESTAAMSPVAHALVDIGVPAISAVLDKIAETDDLKIIERCVRVCRAAEGPEVTRFRLQGRLEKETGQKQKDRFKSALDALDALDKIRLPQ